MSWEAVIGLEIHAQLATKSKLFSGAATNYGAEANTQACAVDLGLPGVLPVLNKEVLYMAIKFGLAIGADIARQTVFARKNYFYPDLPKGYQISQMDFPIVSGGYLPIEPEPDQIQKIRITRAHLEEDAGKSIHGAFANMTGIDLNRAGTPLLEIVSEPDIHSAKAAVAYMKKIHTLVQYLEICDGNMQEGSFRCDANVSVRQAGTQILGTRTEIKNLNSFRFIERAINYEIERQIDVIESGGEVVQETRLYDADKDQTRSMRGKEDANDYRYFPDPDLLPITVDESTIAMLQAQLPELPDSKCQRYINTLGLTVYDATVLTASKQTADFFEAVIKHSVDPKLAANWINGTLAAALNKKDLDIEHSPVSPEQLAGLLQRITDNTLSSTIAKQVFDTLWLEGGSADAVIEAKGLKQITDTTEIDAIIDQVIDRHPAQVENYLNAEQEKRKKMMGFFVGQVMKLSAGKANPTQVNQRLLAKLKN